MTINFNDITDTATPSTGNFSVGGNAIVKGTGQNLLTYSQSFTSGWLTAGGTTTTNSVTDPLGTTTAATLTQSSATALNFYQSFSVVNGVTYTWSIYAKAGTSSSIQLAPYGTGSLYIVGFNLSTGIATNVSGTGTSTIASVGNGWYRCTATATATVTGSLGYFQLNLLGSSSTCYVWGAQVELGSTLNTYIPTTTTAVYGTPTISLAGVSGLGLQSDGSLYVQPAGTGALQAQATTSSAVGGNARGTNAVDWQTSRSNAVMVASGAYSVVAGGTSNRATNQYAFSGGGNNNLNSGYIATLIGGNSQTASGTYSVVGGGFSNNANTDYATVVGGQSNTAQGYYNFIGAGFTNSGTSSSAVTTQSGTMNGTTAVTLSGSNASIKVGQYITGTSIAGDTYVAAISGTSLTLSKNASGSSTSTLSFYTPHGAVVAGGNNQATGAYSFVGGGGDAGTSANGNVASGDWSFVGGGSKNTASGLYSFVGGGGGPNYPNTASAFGSTVVAGLNNLATAQGASVLGGAYNQATGLYSSVLSGVVTTTRSLTGSTVFGIGTAAYNYGNFQSALINLAAITTDATATVLTSTISAASGTNQVILPNNSAYYFRGNLIAGVTGGGNTKGWSIEGVIKRGAGVGTTALVGTPTIMSSYADVGAATWAVTATADTTNGGLAITVTGQASTTIRWVCRMVTSEMTF